jgi:2-succinyl-6-hydroxy-2,4-cyclohexadiene-1-carboxylate synthase
VGETLVLLHGFAGTRHTWEEVGAHMGRHDAGRQGYRPLALDLPGHGDAADVESPITFEGSVEHVLAHCPERFALAGYSLGGRIALQVALAAPERVSRLVLVSTTAGISDTAERKRRREADRRLADELERIPYDAFIERWRDQPLFAQDPPAVRALAVADHRRNRPGALAAALRGLGTGEMEPVWDRLGTLQMPVLVIAGERDEKFRALGERLVVPLVDGRLLTVPGGHVLPLETPAELATAFAEASRS